MILIIVSLHLFVLPKVLWSPQKNSSELSLRTHGLQIILVLRLFFHNYHVHTDLFAKFLGLLGIGHSQLFECPLFKFCICHLQHFFSFMFLFSFKFSFSGSLDVSFWLLLDITFGRGPRMNDEDEEDSDHEK